MKEFTNIVCGFVNQKTALSFVDDFKKMIKDGDKDTCILDRKQAIEVFSPEGETDELGGKIKRFFQKNLGGGPAEFIRDIKEMGSDTRLVVIETDNLNEEQVEKARELALTYNLAQAKHFGEYSVEHLTHKSEHREEMPQV